MNSGSELTDVDDDQEFSLSAKSKSKAKTKAEDYTIRGALKVPRATTFTCQSLYQQIHQQDIDLQPEYQRAVVWPDSKQIGLIDSIFRNFYVPPVIFVVHVQDDGGERRVCVDGKQRLTSIHRFIGGEIPYKDAFTGEKFIFKDTGRIKAHVLPERFRKLFLNKQIVCMEYQDITPDNEREIFQRVQLGMALTPAEKLQAISGPRADFIRELLDTYVVDQLASHITWDISRANDFRGLATSVYSISRWPHLITMPSLSGIESWLQESEDLDEDFCEDVQDTLRIFCDLAKDPKLSKPFALTGVKKVAPMEIIAISILIHANKKKMTMAQLSEAIELLRKDVRKNEKDIRQNTRTMKLFLAFLKDLNSSQVTPDPGAPAAYFRNSSGAKRKRSVKTSQDDVASSSTHRTPTLTSPPQPSVTPVQTPQLPIPTVVARPVPTAPAASRTSSANLPPRPNTQIPSFPAMRSDSLGENLMARMMSGSQPPAQAQGIPDLHGVRSYHPSRDPRNPAYQNQPPGGDTGPSWTRR